MNFNILKNSYPKELVNPMSNDILGLLRGSSKLESTIFVSFLMKEIANTKILANIEEKSSEVMQQIVDEV